MRRTVTAGTSTNNFLWDINYSIPQLVTETSGLGVPTRTYLYGTRRVAMKNGGVAPHYYHHDGLGSVVGMSSPLGTAEWAYDYDAFGNSTATTKLDPLAPPNPMRFTGEYLDGTDLYHLRARQYDANLGRFQATDPQAPLASRPYASSYVYVDNRPVSFVDTEGRALVLAPAVPLAAKLLGDALAIAAGLWAVSSPSPSVGQGFSGSSTAILEPCIPWNPNFDALAAMSGADSAHNQGIEQMIRRSSRNQFVPTPDKIPTGKGSYCARHPALCTAAAIGAVGGAAAGSATHHPHNGKL